MTIMSDKMLEAGLVLASSLLYKLYAYCLLPALFDTMS